MGVFNIPTYKRKIDLWGLKEFYIEIYDRNNNPLDFEVIKKLASVRNYRVVCHLISNSPLKEAIEYPYLYGVERKLQTQVKLLYTRGYQLAKCYTEIRTLFDKLIIEIDDSDFDIQLQALTECFRKFYGLKSKGYDIIALLPSKNIDRENRLKELNIYKFLYKSTGDNNLYCPFFQSGVYISTSGNMYPCEKFRMEEKDNYGNILDKRDISYFASDLRRRLLYSMKHVALPDICKNCNYAGVAQRVEQLPCKQKVEGSTPSSGLSAFKILEK